MITVQWERGGWERVPSGERGGWERVPGGERGGGSGSLVAEGWGRSRSLVGEGSVRGGIYKTMFSSILEQYSFKNIHTSQMDCHCNHYNP